jgi:hypothetical protein
VGASLVRQAPVRGAEQEGIEAAIVLDRADAVGRQAHLDLRGEHIGPEGGFLQVGQEAPAGLVVGVADVVARQDALAGDAAAAGHGGNPETIRARG